MRVVHRCILKLSILAAYCFHSQQWESNENNFKKRRLFIISPCSCFHTTTSQPNMNWWNLQSTWQMLAALLTGKWSNRAYASAIDESMTRTICWWWRWQCQQRKWSRLVTDRPGFWLVSPVALPEKLIKRTDSLITLLRFTFSPYNPVPMAEIESTKPCPTWGNGNIVLRIASLIFFVQCQNSKRLLNI